MKQDRPQPGNVRKGVEIQPAEAGDGLLHVSAPGNAQMRHTRARTFKREKAMLMAQENS